MSNRLAPDGTTPKTFRSSTSKLLKYHNYTQKTNTPGQEDEGRERQDWRSYAYIESQ